MVSVDVVGRQPDDETARGVPDRGHPVAAEVVDGNRVQMPVDRDVLQVVELLGREVR